MRDADALLHVEAILQGAAEIGQSWSRKRADLTLDEKSLGQFASDADLEIEHYIRAALSNAFPTDRVIGEELGGELTPDQSGWAIDPIDGTSNFVLGLPIWGISLGYVENGASRLGGISLPDMGVTLSAASGHGLRVNGQPVSHSKTHPAVKLIALGENDHETGRETDQRAQDLRDQDFSVVRYRCAVFSLAMSALGRLSGYVEHGCGLWDIAAAETICREAGMTVDTAAIAPGRYAIDARWPEAQ